MSTKPKSAGRKRSKRGPTNRRPRPLAALPLVAFEIPEFCEAIRISRSTLWNLRQRGEGPRLTRVGGRILITRKDADEWLTKRASAS